MRPVHTVLILLLCVLVMGGSYYGLWRNEHADEIAHKRAFGFPAREGVTAIVVRPLTISAQGLKHGDSTVVATLLDQLANAPRTSFGDPEPSGKLYTVQLWAGEHRVDDYTLNDLRGIGSNSGKIYPFKGAKSDEVWNLSGATVEALTGVKVENAGAFTLGGGPIPAG